MMNTNAEELLLSLTPQQILDSLNDGVYVTDTRRRIIYWSRTAERITGWTAGQMVGRTCFDDTLCHVDKDGHRLCGESLCPLHRSMVTGTGSVTPLIVFAQGSDGRRIPMQVSVAPLRDAQGKIVGGVETFRDMTEMVGDLERAQMIQGLAMTQELAPDERVAFDRFSMPCDIIGGDFHLIERVDEGRHAFMLADVMGHGISAALYTMQLRALWNEYRTLLHEPQRFVETLSRQLNALVRGEGAFATAQYGLYDAEARTLQLAGAGCPPMFLFRARGEVETIQLEGLPLGMAEDEGYDVETLQLEAGDALLLFTDGATEVFDAQGCQLRKEGLLEILKKVGYPMRGLNYRGIVRRLLEYSGGIRLDDDVTFMEMRVR